MGTSNSTAWQVLIEIRDLLVYHTEELKKLAWDMGLIFACSAVLAHAWYSGWEGGVTASTLWVLDAILPVESGTILAAPVGFMVGILFGVLFDDYKRLQGIFLFSAGLLGVGMVKVLFSALNLYWTRPLTMLMLGVAFVLGLAYVGLFERLRSDGLTELETGYNRFRKLILGVGALGIFEAVIDTNLFRVNESDPLTFADVSVPVSIMGQVLGPEHGSIFVSGGLAVIYGAALFVLSGLLISFNDHDIQKEVLILGPDRAGKTWFMGGSAYSLMDAAIQGEQSVDPNLNPSLNQLRDVFVNEEFDDPELEPNDPGEYNFYEFTFRHGFIKQQRVTVNTIDYAGEHLTDITIGTEEAEDAFEDKWGTSTVPSFEELREMKQNNNIDVDQIPSLISVKADRADLVGLVLPMDDFAENLDDNELPQYLDQQDLEGRRSNRSIPRRHSDNSKYGYFEAYSELCQRKNFFFLGTMSDIYLRTYNLSGRGSGYPITSWETFREHVWEFVNDGDIGFDPGTNLDMNDHKYLYPVYFEPDPNDPRTDRGEIKPNLDWDEDHYPLRGLQYVLKRMGR